MTSLLTKKIREKIKQLEDQGWGHLPICVAKTQYSFSTDPLLLGAPSDHVVPIRDVVLASGAGFRGDDLWCGHDHAWITSQTIRRRYLH